MALLRPGSRALGDLVGNAVTRDIYRVLYDSRQNPPTIHDIRNQVALSPGSPQQHLDRRLRELDEHFEIERGRRGAEMTYRLRRQRPVPRARTGISKQIRAWVLRDQRCAQCGRTPTEDGVKLQVGHKIPLSWGGTSDPENLQALYSECNEGKRNYYFSIKTEAPEIVKAFTYGEVHVRIGEALKALTRRRSGLTCSSGSRRPSSTRRTGRSVCASFEFSIGTSRPGAGMSRADR